MGVSSDIQVGLSTSPGESGAGATFYTQPIVQLQDASGNIVNNSSAPVTLTITTGTGTSGAILSGNFTINSINGIATFGGLKIDKAGSGYTLTATSGNLTQAISHVFNVYYRGDAIGSFAGTNYVVNFFT